MTALSQLRALQRRLETPASYRPQNASIALGGVRDELPIIIEALKAEQKPKRKRKARP